jgi:hypothetical protein
MSEWVAAMANEEAGGDLVVDVNTGVYGHRVSMLDFARRTWPASARWARSSASTTGRPTS